MVAPVLPIQTLQYGVETVAGTLVPATRVVDHLSGTAQWRRDMRSIIIANAGSYANAHRGYAGQEQTEVDFTASATYDRLADVGAMFFDKVSTGSGTGATRTWTFTPNNTVDNLARYSFEWGGTNFPSAYTLSGATGMKLDISIKPNESWQLKQTVLGIITTPGSLTGALSLPSSLTGDDVLWTQSSVYIDTTSAYGSTQQVGRIVSADFSLTNGVTARHTLDGVAYPYRVALSARRVVECTVVAEYDSQTQYTAAFASTVQRVQLKGVNGSKSAKINVNGYWDTIVLGNDNGVITTQLKLKGLYDPTVLTSDVQLVVVNGVTTLTTIP